MATTVALTDGGYLQITPVSGGESLQKYDSSGAAVGSPYTAPTNATIAPLTGGGYAVAFLFSFQVTTVETVFFSAAAQASLAVYEPGSSFTLAASPSGGLVEGTHPSPNFGGQPASHIFYFDTAGHLALPDLQVWSNATPVVSVAGDGTYQVNWSDNVGPLSLTIDPANPVAPTPPPAPSVTLIDDYGPVTGSFGSGVSTDDATPTLRVTVTEPGRIYVNFIGQGGVNTNLTPYQVTSADVARGYVDIASPGGEGSHSFPIVEAGPDGVIGAGTSFAFTVDQTPAVAPTIIRALDDVGAVQRVVTSGGSTDDSAPTLEVRFNPAGLGNVQAAAAGDQVQLLVDGAMSGSPIMVTADAIAKGYLDITATGLSGGSHSLTARITDAAGNVGAASAPFTLTVQPDSGSPPPAPSGLLAGGRGTINLTDGGFLEAWSNAGTSSLQKFDGAGNPVGPLAQVTGGGANFGALTALSDGGYVGALGLPTGLGLPAGLDLRVYDASGAQVGDAIGNLSNGQLVSSSAGGFMIDWAPSTRFYQGLPIAAFGLYDNAGHAIYSGLRLYYNGALPTLSVEGNGDYLLSWTSGSTARSVEIDPNSPPDLAPPPAPAISEYVGGGYVPPGQAVQQTPTLRFSVSGLGTIYWGFSGNNGGETTIPAQVTAADVARGYVEVEAPNFSPSLTTLTVFARAANAYGVIGSDVASYTYTIAPAGPSGIAAYGAGHALSASAGWTSAAVLSNHALAVVGAKDGGYGSHVAAEQTYDASGSQTASAALMGYAPAGQLLTPKVTALEVGGFYRVDYAGSGDYEVYNAQDQRVFVHNTYSNPGGQFTALANGGYLVTDFPDQVMGLFDSHANNVGWLSTAGFAQPLSIQALSGGGFAFVYADHVSGFSASGGNSFNMNLGASSSSFATAQAATADGGLAEVWLSPDSGQYGLATSIRFQTFSDHGQSAALAVAQDLDPWHTTFQLQAHADGSAAILWSQGGGVFGAEYSGGGVGPAHAAVAGDLSAMVLTQLPGDEVGMAWLQNGHVWAQIFDPSTGAVERGDLGATDVADLSTVHLLATASGGLAVSWRASGAVEAVVLDRTGHVSPLAALAGDFLGVDSLGHAITLHDAGGTPVLQDYALNNDMFWTA